MNFSFNLDNGVLTVSLEGRLDTEASVKFEADLAEICRNNPHESMVFEMTGFSRIMTIRKALRKIDLEKCERIGFGGNGAVYRVSEDEIVKVNYNPSTYATLELELSKAKEAFLLGIPSCNHRYGTPGILP